MLSMNSLSVLPYPKHNGIDTDATPHPQHTIYVSSINTVQFLLSHRSKKIKNFRKQNKERKYVLKTYAKYNDVHSSPVNRHMCHFYIGHVQRTVHHMVIDHKDFQHIRHYSDIFQLHKHHSVRNPNYKQL